MRELVDAALEVEYKLDHLELAGVGTNLGCYGSVAATPEKLRELVSAAEAVERAIGRELQYISGGASTSVHMVLDGTLPARVNHLRIGEFALLGGIYGCYPDFLRRDVFTLRMEVVECKPKPSYPVGERPWTPSAKRANTPTAASAAAPAPRAASIRRSLRSRRACGRGGPRASSEHHS